MRNTRSSSLYVFRKVHGIHGLLIQRLRRRYPSFDQPHNELTTHVSIRAFHWVDVQLWVRTGKWGKENDVYAWPWVPRKYTAYTACIISTCKAFTAHFRIYMETVSCQKIRKSLNRVNEVRNGITEPWNGYRIGQICQMQAMNLLHCGCSVACKGNCKGFRAGIWCSQLSKCDGGCTNNVTWSWTVNRMYWRTVFQFLVFLYYFYISISSISSISHFSKSQKNQFL